MNPLSHTRRDFLQKSVYFGAATIATGPVSKAFAVKPARFVTKMKFGLVTYLWAKDWDLPTLITNCEKTGVLGVELRTKHAHGVESKLNAQQRRDVKKRFDDSAVTLVGLGTNFAFHHTDSARLRSDIDDAKEYLRLSHDVGGSGVKVKPNDLPEGVPHEKTIEQIGKSLNELGRFAADLGQQVRNKGKVIGKSVINGEYLVNIDVVCEGHDGVPLVKGIAQVQLPSKEDFEGQRY